MTLKAFLLCLLSPLVFAGTYTIATVAGGTECGDGGPAILAQLGAPEGLVIDRAGDIYVADSIDHRVRRISSTGIVTTVAGDGYPGFRGDGGPAQTARLNAPYGLAADAAGNLYIADLGNGRIRKVSPDGIIQTIAGGPGTALRQPRNLALDSAGNLYFSDFSDHRVYRITPAGVITPIAGLGWPGSVKDSESIQAALAPLRGPAGLAFDRSGALYIADSGNHRIRKIQNGWMTTLAAPPDYLNTPTGIAFDASGRIYIADKGAGAVFRLTPPVAWIGGSGATAVLTEPRDIVFDASGNLYIADTRPGPRHSIGVIRRIDSSSRISTFAGGAAFRSPGDDGPPTSAHLDTPSALALDALGNLYIADRNDHRVRKVASGVITTVAGIGFPGSGGDGGFAIRAQLNQPEGIALDSAGNLWVTESAANRLRRVTAGGYIDTISAGVLNSPSGIAVDTAGNAYIADTGAQVVRKVGPDGRVFTLEPVSAVLENPTGVCLDPNGNLYVADTGHRVIFKVTPDGVISPLGAGVVDSPARVALDAEGNLYIADPAGHRVYRLTPNGEVAALAGTGARGYSGDGGPALSAELNEPADVAVDSSGNVFIADRGNGLVRKLTPDPLPPPPEVQHDAPEVASLVNSASLLPGAVAPGELATLFGSALGPGGTQVLFDGQSATLLYVDAGQINLQVPDGIAGRPSAEIEVRTGAGSLRLIVPVTDASPGIFTLAAGRGQATAVNEDGTPNSAAHPAPPGSVVTLYATGEGRTLPPLLTIAGRSAPILSSASVAGLLEIHAKVSEFSPPGPQPVMLFVGSALSQFDVTLAIR